jgi:xylose isomerase
MAEHLRFGVCYWHTFAWDGFDIFGAGTLDRPWHPNQNPSLDPMDAAKLKMEAAFEFFAKLGAPFFSFHDVDMAPAGSTFAETCRNLDEMVELAAGHMERTGTKVLWGGREGYETLLNTDMRRELDQLGRFMNLVVEHKYSIGFDGTLLIEPKPMEPTKHQYDYDVATVHSFLSRYGLENEVKVNNEVNHATLSGHDFHHEVATAVNNGIFGSIDANAGDDRLGWDLDRFPVSVEQMTLGMLEILRGGGFTTGGLMFDCKLRRQSVSRDDLFIAHIGGMDVMARSLLAAAAIIDDGELDERRAARYAGWDAAQDLLDGKVSLQQIHDELIATNVEPAHASGRQELLEGLVARHIERVR